MSSLLERFRRVRKGLACPLCQHTDWCLVEYDSAGEPLRVLCQRVPSGKHWGEAGHLHVLGDGGQPADWCREIVLRSSTPSVAMHERIRRAHEQLLFGNLASKAGRELGVSPDALVALGAGIELRMLLFPMKDDRGRLIGIRTRSADGKKRAVTGSQNGLFLPRNLKREDDVYVCEGPTDTAALLSLGLTAVGRPSCNGGLTYLTRLVRTLRPSRVVVVADHDEAGTNGAAAAAYALRIYARDVRVIVPPNGIKDAREWGCRGATPEIVALAVAAAAPLALEVHGGIQ